MLCSESSDTPATCAPCRAGAADHGLLLGGEAVSVVSVLLEPLGYLCVAQTPRQMQAKAVLTTRSPRIPGEGRHRGQAMVCQVARLVWCVREDPDVRDETRRTRASPSDSSTVVRIRSTWCLQRLSESGQTRGLLGSWSVGV